MNVVIVGSGIGGITLAEQLLKLEPRFQVTILTRETDGYYSRPLLSHGFTRENIETQIVMKSVETLLDLPLNFVPGADVTAINPDRNTVEYIVDGRNRSLSYDKLVFATGSAALVPGAFRDQQERFFLFNSLADLKRIRAHRRRVMECGMRPRWAVVGGGLIGCEVASDLVTAGDEVCLYHAMNRLMERQLEETDSARLASLLGQRGVEISLDCAVQGFVQQGGEYSVVADGQEHGGYCGIIVACGFQPRIGLAQAAGLNVNRGILVNGYLTTSASNIHAIGDVAECEDGHLYAYVTPIRNQAIWLAGYLCGNTTDPWEAPFFKPRAKVKGFDAEQGYKF